MDEQTAIKAFNREKQRLRYFINLALEMRKRGEPEEVVDDIGKLALDAQKKMHAVSVSCSELQLKMEEIIRDERWILNSIM